MWVVLLDHSGSMGESFRGGTISGRTTMAKAAQKLEAAKRAVLERIRGLSGEEQIMIVAFTSSARTIFDGIAGDFDEIRTALDGLRPTNGTSISAAFEHAADLLESKDKSRARALLVSDCKSDLELAVNAADRLARHALVIDVLLIDPDANTEKAARAMIRLGEVQAVVSAEEIRTAVIEGDVASQHFSLALSRATEKAQQGAAETFAKRAKASGREPGAPVSFSAGYPPAITPRRQYPLYVFAHPAHLEDEIRDLISRRLSELTGHPSIGLSGIPTRLPDGAVISIEPSIPNLQVNPSRVDLIWRDRIEDVRFLVEAAEDDLDKFAKGSIDIWYGTAQIACIPISIKISDDVAEVRSTIGSAQMFGSVFTSYSSHDRPIVDRAREYYQALGIAVFQDSQDLKDSAGIHWQRVLDGLIIRADAFQLYWSHPASTSKQVKRELEVAVGENVRKGERWIRPLRWSEDTPDLPKEISHLQMGWLPGFETATRRPLPGADRVRCTVTPLVPCPREQQRIIERECREAVLTVESAIGIRCYPPPVLLVDDYAILSQRQGDSPPDNEEALLHRFAAAGYILQVLSLEIHTRFARGKINGEYPPGIKAKLGLADEPRRIALELAEWVFQFAAETVLKAKAYTQPKRTRKGWPPSKIGSPDPLPPLQDVIKSESWRQKLASFMDALEQPTADVVDSLAELLDALRRAFNEAEATYGSNVIYLCGYGYDIIPQCLHELQREESDLHLAMSLSGQSIAGTFSMLKQLFTHATNVFIETFRKLLGDGPGGQRGLDAAHNYALFIPASIESDRSISMWAAERGVPDVLTFPGCDRILLCLQAIQRSVTQLDDAVAREMTRGSVLTHEMLHAAISGAVGRNQARRAARQGAERAEESLAVWVEFHAARDYPSMRKVVEAYAATGHYPDWPYAGMPAIEALHKKEGLDGVRQFAEQLIAYPTAAAQDFDSLVDAGP